ncbi:MAG: MerR family transcriptional regulator [Actinobacteria bacterium]|nr:MerR family transcriptional regulator [Actinomycetota bacterium]
MEPEIRLFKIGELERLSGVPRYTIHQYVRNGLLPEPVKTSKTMAYYNDSHLERLLAIQEIKGSSRVPLSFLKKVLANSEGVEKSDDKRRQPAQTGEPKEETAERRRQQIREAAIKIFLDKGFQQTRVKDITTAAGISTGTFYVYYKDKQELFMDAIDKLTHSTVAAIEDVARKDSDFLIRLATTAQIYMENYGYFSGIINQLRGMMASTAPSAREKFIALHNQLANPILHEIHAAMEKGLIREVNPELLTRAIMGIVEFLSIYLSFNDRYTTPQAISFMVDMVMNGIGQG